jgi:hypothetical protein
MAIIDLLRLNKPEGEEALDVESVDDIDEED